MTKGGNAMRRVASIEKIDDLFLSRASRDNHRYELKNRITCTDSFRLVNDRHFHHFTDSIILVSDNLLPVRREDEFHSLIPPPSNRNDCAITTIGGKLLFLKLDR